MNSFFERSNIFEESYFFSEFSTFLPFFKVTNGFRFGFFPSRACNFCPLSKLFNILVVFIVGLKSAI